jgi:ribonuclease Z
MEVIVSTLIGRALYTARVSDRDLIVIDAPRFRIEGRSRAGHETFFRIRDLGVAFDVGRGPDAVTAMPRVFVTHAHLDHAAGIPYYFAQRHLHRRAGGRVYVPAESEPELRAILAAWQRVANTSWPETELIALAERDSVDLGSGREVLVHRASHRVAANSYELFEKSRSIFFYTGDTDRRLLERNAAMYESEVLMIECSFLGERHRANAEKYQHIHIDDIADFAERFQNEMVILTHFSLRYSPREIRDEVTRRCPAILRERLRFAL